MLAAPISMSIHPTARIHPSAVLTGDVEVGEGTEIGALCYIEGPARIGRDNKIYPHCVIGTDCEHASLEPSGPILIGDSNVIRELTVVQRGSGERPTEIGNDCYLMDHIHVAHDCLVGDGVTIAPNTVLAGHVRILEGATVGVGTGFHQHSTVGAFAMIGMGAVVTKDVPPFCVVTGSPAGFLRFNSHRGDELGVDFATDIEVTADGLVGRTDLMRRHLADFAEHSRRRVLPIEATE